jgi:hypothetical protein
MDDHGTAHLGRVGLPSNKPLHPTIPPQGYRSILKWPGTCGGLAGERQIVRQTGGAG